MKVTPIGSCRVALPLKRAARLHPVGVNLTGLYGYTHSSAEAVQMVRWLQEAVVPAPPGVVSMIMSDVDLPQGGRRHVSSDLYIVELSSAKVIEIGDSKLQSNYVKTRFADFFSDTQRTRTFWSVARRGREARRTEWMLNEPAFQKQSAEDQELLRAMTLRLQTFDELVADMRALIESLPRVVFVTHCNARTADGAYLKTRSKLIDSVKAAGREIGCQIYDPTPLMEGIGQQRAISGTSFDFSHYTPTFERLLYDDWVDVFGLPHASSAGEGFDGELDDRAEGKTSLVPLRQAAREFGDTRLTPRAPKGAFGNGAVPGSGSARVTDHSSLPLASPEAEVAEALCRLACERPKEAQKQAASLVAEWTAKLDSGLLNTDGAPDLLSALRRLSAINSDARGTCRAIAKEQRSLGRKAFERSDYQATILHGRAALAAGITPATLAVTMARAFCELRDYRAARHLLEQPGSLGNDPLGWETRGCASLHLRDFPDALKCFERVLAIPEAGARLRESAEHRLTTIPGQMVHNAEKLAADRRYDEAWALASAAQNEKGAAEVRATVLEALRADLNNTADDCDRSAALARSIVEKEPGDADAQRRLAQALTHAESYDDAEKAWRRLLAIQPDAQDVEHQINHCRRWAAKTAEVIERVARDRANAVST